MWVYQNLTHAFKWCSYSSVLLRCVLAQCKAILGVYYSVSPKIDTAIVPGRVVTWGCCVTLSALFLVYILSGVSISVLLPYFRVNSIFFFRERVSEALVWLSVNRRAVYVWETHGVKGSFVVSVLSQSCATKTYLADLCTTQWRLKYTFFVCSFLVTLLMRHYSLNPGWYWVGISHLLPFHVLYNS